MASLAELREQKKQLEAKQKQLDKEIEQAKKVELQKARDAVCKKVDALTDEEKKFILDHMQHEYNSCIEGASENGYSYSRETWRCRKCMLTEIFNGEWGGKFDFDISVDIHEVTV